MLIVCVLFELGKRQILRVSECKLQKTQNFSRKLNSEKRSENAEPYLCIEVCYSICMLCDFCYGESPNLGLGVCYVIVVLESVSEILIIWCPVFIKIS